MTSFTQVSLRLAGMATSPRQLVTSRLAAALKRADLPTRSELMALRPATRVLIIGFGAFIGLVAVTTISALISLELPPIAAPAWFGSQGAIIKSKVSDAGTAAGFENIVQRPLFSRSRKLFVAAVEPAPALPPPRISLDRGMTLKGVFMSDGIAKAFVVTTQNPVGVWVKVNEQIDGWRVAAVDPEHVVLEGQGEKLMVPLHPSGK